MIDLNRIKEQLQEIARNIEPQTQPITINERVGVCETALAELAELIAGGDDSG